MRLAVLAAVAGLAMAGCAQAGPPPPALHCRHALAFAASSSDLPVGVAASLPWMALHGEPWNRTDAITPGERTAAYVWAARSQGRWLVAFSSGGIACCRVRMVLFQPSAGSPGGYRMVSLPVHGPDLFGDPTCAGIDAILDAYPTGG